MKKIYGFLLCCTVSFMMCAQQNTSDHQLVYHAIENYFYGYVERDATKLQLAFDTENGTMKRRSMTNDGKEIVTNLYVKDLIPKWSSRKKLSEEEKNNCALKVLKIDIIENELATATIEMKIGKIIYLDVLSLQQINNHWKITNKMFLKK